MRGWSMRAHVGHGEQWSSGASILDSMSQNRPEYDGMINHKPPKTIVERHVLPLAACMSKKDHGTHQHGLKKSTTQSIDSDFLDLPSPYHAASTTPSSYLHSFFTRQAYRPIKPALPNAEAYGAPPHHAALSYDRSTPGTQTGRWSHHSCSSSPSRSTPSSSSISAASAATVHFPTTPSSSRSAATTAHAIASEVRSLTAWKRSSVWTQRMMGIGRNCWVGARDICMCGTPGRGQRKRADLACSISWSVWIK